jgi:AcrR family transcriptional regulator
VRGTTAYRRIEGYLVHGGSLARTHEGAPGLPRGRSRLPEHAVRAAQHDRLLRAMIAAVDAVGYADVTVADVVRRARVSRTAFYAHFSDKDDCFFAASAAGAQQLFEHTTRAVRDLPAGTDDESSLRTALQAYLGFLSAEPAFTKVLYVELPASGLRAQSLLQSAYGRWAELNRRWHVRARVRQPDWPQVPAEVYRALAGATGELVRDVVTAGETDRLPLLEDTLVRLHLAVLAGRRWEPVTASP